MTLASMPMATPARSEFPSRTHGARRHSLITAEIWVRSLVCATPTQAVPWVLTGA